jgi:hypothetical protein
MWWSIGILVYFLPTILALKKESVGAIFLFNAFVGVTGIGWIIAMLWSVMADEADYFKGMKLKCKRCKQQYEVPNESWYGQEFICSRCDNFIKIPTPWMRSVVADLSVPLVIFIWVFATMVWHFTI